MEFSRQECWSGLPCSSPGDLPHSGIEPGSPTLQADSLPSEPPGKLFESRALCKSFLILTSEVGKLSLMTWVACKNEYLLKPLLNGRICCIYQWANAGKSLSFFLENSQKTRGLRSHSCYVEGQGLNQGLLIITTRRLYSVLQDWKEIVYLTFSFHSSA